MTARASPASDVADLSPAQRRSEIAAILARAALRLRARAALGPTGADEAKISGEPSQDRLDLPADSSVHGDRVVDAPERARLGGSP